MLKSDEKLKNHVMPITGTFNALLMFAYEKVSDISSEIIFLAHTLIQRVDNFLTVWRIANKCHLIILDVILNVNCYISGNKGYTLDFLANRMNFLFRPWSWPSVSYL